MLHVIRKLEKVCSWAYLLKNNQVRQFIKFLISITSRTHIRDLSKRDQPFSSDVNINFLKFHPERQQEELIWNWLLFWQCQRPDSTWIQCGTIWIRVSWYLFITYWLGPRPIYSLNASIICTPIYSSLHRVMYPKSFFFFQYGGARI